MLDRDNMVSRNEVSSLRNVDFVERETRPRVQRMDPTVFYGRLIATIVVVIVVLIATVCFLLGSHVVVLTPLTTPHDVVIFGQHFLVDMAGPPKEIVVAALLAMLMISGFAVAFEVIEVFMTVGNRRRYLQLQRTGVADKMLGGPISVTVFIPAHNEEASLPETLASLLLLPKRFKQRLARKIWFAVGVEIPFWDLALDQRWSKQI